MKKITTLLILCPVLFFSGCVSVAKFPKLGKIYNQSAQYHHPDRNPVILIPGITGSKLIDGKTGKISWGAFGGHSINPQTSQGAQLFALPMQEGVPLDELKDDVIPKGVLEQVKVKIFGLPVQLSAYMNILRTLGAGQYYDEQFAKATGMYYGKGHYTCFQFDYDWRRDISENARRLHEFIITKRVYVQQQIEKEFGIKDYDVKFDLVAHSMGGLLARYYLEYGPHELPRDGTIPKITWEGAQHVEKLVMIGTPNAGSLEAFRDLIYGIRFSIVLPKYEPALLGTMPSMYELLPRTRHRVLVDAAHPNDWGLDILDSDLWIRMHWGLALQGQDRVLKQLLPEVRSKEERRRIALDQLKKSLSKAKQFSQAMDKPITLPAGLSMYLFAGDARLTSETAAVDRATGQIRIIKMNSGDGTVLRSSALLDERLGGQWKPTLDSPITWTAVNFLFDDHLGLTKDTQFTDNLLFLLLEKGRHESK